ncbi:MAG: polysaccharide pyruvyl transferase family protein [Kiritimatiellia bacterium]
MKTGILTYHNAVNYGAFLQAYALQNYLLSEYCENVIIDYKNMRFTLNEYLCLISRRYPSYTWMNYRKLAAFGDDYRKLKLTPRCYRGKRLGKLHFDCVIFGSDSIWNYTNAMSGFDPVYFGKHVNSRKLISYAASFGPDTVGDPCPRELPELLNRFSAFGVRDTNTKAFVKELTGREAQIVLDPTFLYSFEKEMIEPRDKDYIFVYSVHLSREQGRDLQAYARSVNRKTISVGYYSPYCDINRACVTPFEWLGYLRKADMVLTGMYHGTLFSLHFNRPFCAIGTPYRANKIRDILQRYGLQSRMVDGPQDGLADVLRTPLDFSAVNLRLQDEIRQSREFLTRSMTS